MLATKIMLKGGGQQSWLVIGFLLSAGLFLLVFLFAVKYEAHQWAKQEKIIQEELDFEKEMIKMLKIELIHLSRPQRIKELYIRQGKLKNLAKDKIIFYGKPARSAILNHEEQ